MEPDDFSDSLTKTSQNNLRLDKRFKNEFKQRIPFASVQLMCA